MNENTSGSEGPKRPRMRWRYILAGACAVIGYGIAIPACFGKNAEQIRGILEGTTWAVLFVAAVLIGSALGEQKNKFWM